MESLETVPTLPTVAIFDFDGTLTKRDSLLPFLKSWVGRWGLYYGLLHMSPTLIAYGLKLIPNWVAKQRLLIYFLSQKKVQELEQTAQTYARENLSDLLRPDALVRLRWHQAQGHQTLLVSASLEAYLRPWAKQVGIDQVIGTQLEFHQGCLTGRFLGKNCYGPEKVRRLEKILGNLKHYSIYAYGDSKGDRELLSVASFPYYRTFKRCRAYPR
ncbi:MAG: HAD family hydrolase [Cyanobacteria bacterium P01_D01_bin.44]